MRIKGWQELNLPSRKSSVLSKARKFSVQIPLAWLLTIIWEIFSASHLTFQAWQTSDSESLSTLNVYCYNSTVTREWERSTTAVLLFLGFYGLPCFFTQDGNDNDLDFFCSKSFPHSCQVCKISTWRGFSFHYESNPQNVKFWIFYDCLTTKLTVPYNNFYPIIRTQK